MDKSRSLCGDFGTSQFRFSDGNPRLIIIDLKQWQETAEINSFIRLDMNCSVEGNVHKKQVTSRFKAEWRIYAPTD